jgi:FixJ family two-component response regulator
MNIATKPAVVIVVDDNSDFLKGVARLLTVHGLAVRIFSSAEALSEDGDVPARKRP